jgi:hypothetical protein
VLVIFRFRALVGAFVGIAVGTLRPDLAHACEMAVPEEHEVDPAQVGVDVTPPDPPVVTTGVTRSYGPRSSGCTESASSCDGFGSIEFIINDPHDDRTPAESLGYKIELVGGKAPPGLHVPDKPLRAFGGENLFIHFSDPGPDDQEHFDAVFKVTAVDLAGNESEPSAAVHATHAGGDTGCALIAGRRRTPWPAFMLAVVFGAWARRRARRA